MPAERLNEPGATETAHGVASGEITSEAVVRACLDRIESRETAVHAWAYLDEDLALEQARALDREQAAGKLRGPLHGVPIAVKDIIDTVDMPTEMGSPIYKGHRPPNDAACVGIVRAAGAVILGKTVTAEFAGMAPGATANPHDPTRTPGGSSSGSGAAVADFMVPAAFGTQTGGSVLRPSSYCGIFGFKPTFGTFNLGGVKPAAQSLDTLGLHARELDDIELMTAVLVARAPRALTPPAEPPTIGLCRTPLGEAAQPESIAAIETAAARLAEQGATVRDVELPDIFGGLNAARDTINCYERGRLMAYEWRHFRDQISDILAGSVQRGLDMPYEQYVDAIRLAEACRAKHDALFTGIDVILTPTVDGEAPEGLGFTGNPRFQGFWTVLHLPSLTMPTYRGPNGMPVGIQLVGRYREDNALLDTARWAWDRLGPPAAG